MVWEKGRGDHFLLSLGLQINLKLKVTHCAYIYSISHKSVTWLQWCLMCQSEGFSSRYLSSFIGNTCQWRMTSIWRRILQILVILHWQYLPYQNCIPQTLTIVDWWLHSQHFLWKIYTLSSSQSKRKKRPSFFLFLHSLGHVCIALLI